MEEVLDNTIKTLTITKSGWGYTELEVLTEGEFLSTQTERLFSDDFVAGVCHLDFVIDATKLHRGMNTGRITICDTRTNLVIPVTIMMNCNNEKHAREKEIK